MAGWPLHVAAMKGDCATIRNLCGKSHYDPNQKMTTWFDSEPLGWAASFGQLRAVITLIQCGADPNRPANKACNRPIDDSRRERYEAVTHFLVQFEGMVERLYREDEARYIASLHRNPAPMPQPQP